MNRMRKVLGLCLVMSLILLIGCSSKEETKTDINVSKQEETSKSTLSSNEDVDTEIEETEEVIVEEASKGEDIDYLAIHGIMLDRIYSWIMDGTDGTHIADGEEVIVDAVKTYGDYAHYDMGYAVADVNEDEIPELVIGQTTQEGTGNMIYAVYTWKNGNFGCNVSGAEYGKIVPGKINDAQVFFLTPFSEYDPGMEIYAEGASGASGDGEDVESAVISTEEPQVCAQWIDDVYLEPNGYDVFTADDNAEQRQVVFIAISKVKDFKVLSLSFEGVSENGSMVNFSTTELHSQAELKPERPLMAGMSCDSTIPCYGVSYVDENGVTRSFAIEVSGMDGSLLLSEF